MVAPVVDSEYLETIEKARCELRALIVTKNCAPIMLDLAWLDACTYNTFTKTGGPDGSIRHDACYVVSPNVGLRFAIHFCEPIKAKNPRITYADLYQLAGVVAVEVTGGPTIDFVPGRPDSYVCRRKRHFLDAEQGASHLRDIFYTMGLFDKHIVAFSGGLILGRAHPVRSGFEGLWTAKPLKFGNNYFVELLKGETEVLPKLPTDKALLGDVIFRHYVKLYAEDEDLFFKDYAESHKKLLEFGFAPKHGSAVVCQGGSAAPKKHSNSCNIFLGEEEATYVDDGQRIMNCVHKPDLVLKEIQKMRADNQLAQARLIKLIVIVASIQIFVICSLMNYK